MEKLFFSYRNWELLYGISPFTIETDRVTMREKCDGQEVNYNEESDTFDLSTPWGIITTRGRFCLKKEGEADHTVEEIMKSPDLVKEMAQLVRKDYMEVPPTSQMLAYIGIEDGKRGFAMVTTSKEEDPMLCRFALHSPVSYVSEEARKKMESGLLDKYFSCYPVGLLESTGEMANALVYLTSLDRLSLCIKELTGKDNIKIDYAKLDQFLAHYNETSPEVEKEYKWYYSLITEIMRTFDPGFAVNQG